MEYKWVFEEFWGRGSYPPPTTILSKEDFDIFKNCLIKSLKNNVNNFKIKIILGPSTKQNLELSKLVKT